MKTNAGRLGMKTNAGSLGMKTNARSLDAAGASYAVPKEASG